MNKQGYLGIDVSKGYADFLLLDCNHQVLEDGFQLQDNKQGRGKLRELITVWQAQGLEELYCGVESTGGYENNWYCYLKGFKESNVFVSRLNPKGVKAVSDASLTRTNTDGVSAQNIASYLIRYPEKVDYGIVSRPDNEAMKEGRSHFTYVRMLVKQKVQLNNQFEKLLYQHFSEMLIYCRRGVPLWLLKMLSKYPTARMVCKAGVTRLSVINGISTEKAASLIKKAKDNQQDVSSHAAHVIMSTAKEILHKISIIKEEKQYLTDLFKDTEEVKLISSIPGIGVESAVVILLEIENVDRFGTVKKLSSYFGVHPTYKQSGDGMWGNHMSKKGRSEIRSVLYMCALTGMQCNPMLKQLYARFRSKGMKHYQAAGVTMHKLLRVVYGVLKNKTAFNVETDLKNRENAAEKQQEKEKEIKEGKKISRQKKHRFQVQTTQAPISRRAEQKLKKQIATQTSA